MSQARRTGADLRASEVLRTHWNLPDTPVAHHSGIRRDLWRAGQFWLTSCPASDATRLEREQRLLLALAARLRSSAARLTIPTPQPTPDGGYVVEHGQRAWRLVTHVPGEAPSIEAVETFERLAHGAAVLHDLLRDLPTGLAVHTHALVDRAARCGGRVLRPDWRPLGDDDGERALLLSADRWLGPLIPVLQQPPWQLVHGDWNPLNVKVSDARLGILDFEDVSCDPRAVDLAQLLSTAVIWAGRLDADQTLDLVLDTYQRHAGARAVSRDQVRAAAVAYWVVNYWTYHDRRPVAGDGDMSANFWRGAAIQPSRLRDILRYVGAV